jgi:hypothetical protein
VPPRTSPDPPRLETVTDCQWPAAAASGEAKRVDPVRSSKTKYESLPRPRERPVNGGASTSEWICLGVHRGVLCQRIRGPLRVRESVEKPSAEDV